MSEHYALQSSVPVSTVTEVITRRCYAELMQFVEEQWKKKKKTEPAKTKQDLLEKVQAARARYTSLLAILKWRRTHLATTLKCTKVLEEKRREQEELAGSVEDIQFSIYELGAIERVPMHDVETAIDVLSTGTYSSMPSADVVLQPIQVDGKWELQIRHNALFNPPPLTAQVRQSTKERLNDLVRMKLLNSAIPTGYSSISIKDGKLSCVVDEMFEIVLGVNVENQLSPWHIISLKLYVTAEGIHPTPSTTLIATLQQKINDSPTPLQAAYNTMRDFCSIRMLDILREQAIVLQNSFPSENCPCKLEVYQFNSSSSSNTARLSQPSPAAINEESSSAFVVSYWPGVEEICIDDKTKAPLTPAQWAQLSPVQTNTQQQQQQQQNRATAAMPSTYLYVSLSPEKTLNIEHWPTILDANAQTVTYTVDPTKLSMQKLLNQAMKQHVCHRCVSLYNKLSKSKKSKKISVVYRLRPTKDAVEIEVNGTYLLEMAIDIRNGRFVSRNVGSERKNGLFQLDFAINRNLENGGEALHRWICEHYLDDMEAAGHLLGLQALKHPPLHAVSLVNNPQADSVYFRYPGSDMASPNAYVLIATLNRSEMSFSYHLVPAKSSEQQTNQIVELQPLDAKCFFSDDRMRAKRPRISEESSKKVGYDFVGDLQMASAAGSRRMRLLQLIKQFEAANISCKESVNSGMTVYRRCEPLVLADITVQVLGTEYSFASGWKVSLVQSQTVFTSFGTLALGSSAGVSRRDNWLERVVSQEGNTLILTFSSVHSSSIKDFENALQGVCAMTKLAAEVEQLCGVQGSRALQDSSFPEITSQVRVESMSHTAIILICGSSEFDRFPCNRLHIGWRIGAGFVLEIDGKRDHVLMGQMEVSLRSNPNIVALLKKFLALRPIIFTLQSIESSKEVIPGDLHYFLTTSISVRAIYRKNFGIDILVHSKPGFVSIIDSALGTSEMISDPQANIMLQPIPGLADIQNEILSYTCNEGDLNMSDGNNHGNDGGGTTSSSRVDDRSLTVPAAHLQYALGMIHRFLGSTMLLQAGEKLIKEINATRPIKVEEYHHNSNRATLDVGNSQFFLQLQQQARLELVCCGASASASKQLNEVLIQYFRRKVGSGPYNITAMRSFIRLLASPLPALVEFCELLKKKISLDLNDPAGHCVMGELALVLSGKTAVEAFKHDHPNSEIWFCIRYCLQRKGDDPDDVLSAVEMPFIFNYSDRSIRFHQNPRTDLDGSSLFQLMGRSQHPCWRNMQKKLVEPDLKSLIRIRLAQEGENSLLQALSSLPLA